MDKSQLKMIEVLQSSVRVAILDVLNTNIEGLTASQIKKKLSETGIKGSLPNVIKHLGKLKNCGLITFYNTGVPPRPLYRIDVIRSKAIVPLLETLCEHLETARILGDIRTYYSSLIDNKRRLAYTYDPLKVSELMESFEKDKKNLRELIENCLLHHKTSLSEKEKMYLNLLRSET